MVNVIKTNSGQIKQIRILVQNIVCCCLVKHIQRDGITIVTHSFLFPAAAAEPVSPVARETISVKLLTTVQPGDPASSAPPAIGLNTQEQLVRDHWFSALNLTEDWAACTHIAGRRIKNVCLLLTSASSLVQQDSFTELNQYFKEGEYQISLSAWTFRSRQTKITDPLPTPVEVLAVHCVSIITLFWDLRSDWLIVSKP